MPYYRLYHVKDGHFARVDDFEAVDDAQAFAEVEKLIDDLPVELWCGHRKVRFFEPIH